MVAAVDTKTNFNPLPAPSVEAAAPQPSATQPANNDLPVNKEYMAIDLKETISEHNMYYGLWKAAAIISITAFTILAVAANIAVGIFAPLYLPFVLLGSGLLMKFFFYDSVYKFLDDKAEVRSELATREESVLKELQKLESPDTIDQTFQQLWDLGIPCRIVERQEVDPKTEKSTAVKRIELIRTGSPLPAQVNEGHVLNALARRNYHMQLAQSTAAFAQERFEKAEALRVESNQLQVELARLQFELVQPGQTDKAIKERKNAFDEKSKALKKNEGEICTLRAQAYARTQDTGLSSKVRAAFMEYLIKNPLDQRHMAEIAEIQALDFDQRMMLEKYDADTTYLIRKLGNGTFIKIPQEQIANSSIREIQERIFSQVPAVAANAAAAAA